MIYDRPELIKFFAAKNPLHLFFIALPVLCCFIYFSLSADLSILMYTFLTILGVLWWTFLEYAIHRWLYHTRFKNNFLNYFVGSFHLYHHSEMADRRVYNSGAGMLYLVTPIVLLPFLLLTQSLALTSAIGVGLVAMYYFYECVHFILHYKKFEKGYFAWIQSYHFYHHDFKPNKNFGNTSAIWDMAFGTYDEKYKNYMMSAKTQETLIKSSEEVIYAR
jgi:sterol desaturase/sphingolipid hydroxylase (fatty acid hydroxylase superfamily)